MGLGEAVPETIIDRERRNGGDGRTQGKTKFLGITRSSSEMSCACRRSTNVEHLRNRGFQVMKLKILGSILAGLMLIAGSAQAAVLSLDTTNSIAGNLDANFTSSASGGLASSGDAITIYSGPAIAGAVGGLQLDSTADLKVEYLGKEAGFTNVFHLGGDLFNTDLTIPPVSQTVLGVGAGIIQFLFQTSGSAASAENGGPIADGLSLAFADLGDGSFLALFDDSGTGVDFDDMVVRISVSQGVSQVPLPPAVWLLISAILGLVSFTRICRSEARTA